MFASTSAKLLVQPSRRFFCSCTPAQIQHLPNVSKEPVYVAPNAKKPRKNASANPRKKAGQLKPETELFAALEGKAAINHRPSLINEDSCRDLVRAWGIDKMHDAVILEPYAGKQHKFSVSGPVRRWDADVGCELLGPGGLTRALLELPNVKRVIAVEEAVRYTPLLRVSSTLLSLFWAACLMQECLLIVSV